MLLQDFYGLGFVETYKYATYGSRRKLSDKDAHYEEIQNFVSSLDSSSRSYYDVENLIKSFGYDLISVLSVGNTIKRVECYLDDPNSESSILAFGDIELEVCYDKETKFVFRVLDKYSYFSLKMFESYVVAYDYIDQEISIETLMKRLLDLREKDTKKVRSHFNKELRTTHQLYRTILKRSHSGTQTIKKLLKEETQ